MEQHPYSNALSKRCLQSGKFEAMVKRGFLVAALLAAAFAALPQPAKAISGTAPGYLTVDRVLVVKSERRLYLVHGYHVVKSYPVRLGRSPVGHKVFEGDGRTPEGLYVLGERNTGSEYYRSIRISYPNAHDIAEARQYGQHAGGLVMLHGQPNYTHSTYTEARPWDWTAGCIALSNSDLDEIWAATTPGTVIEILP